MRTSSLGEVVGTAARGAAAGLSSKQPSSPTSRGHSCPESMWRAVSALRSAFCRHPDSRLEVRPLCLALGPCPARSMHVLRDCAGAVFPVRRVGAAPAPAALTPSLPGLHAKQFQTLCFVFKKLHFFFFYIHQDFPGELYLILLAHFHFYRTFSFLGEVLGRNTLLPNGY